MTTAGTSEEKATVREVYRLVGEVEHRLGEKIDGLSDRIDTLVTSHEHRLTVVETDGTTIRRQVDDHETRLGTLETAHNRALGSISTWKVIAGGVLALVCSSIGADLIIGALK